MGSRINQFREATIHDGFALVDGARMHFRHAGTGRPVLLIHGLVGSSSNWRLNMDALARDASVYAVDLLNMGQSQRVRGLDASLAATADQLVAFLDALGLPQADIVGHSHGGAVAMMLAARHPGRVRSLLLFAPANPFCSLGHPLIRFWRTKPGFALACAAAYLPKPLHAVQLRRMWGDPARVADGTVEGYRDGVRVRGTVRHMVAILRSWFGDMAELEAVLPRIGSVPTRMVWGDRDRAVSLASAQPLLQLLPDADLAIVPTAGHVVFEELPELSNRIILEWLHRDHEARPIAQTQYIPVETRTSGAAVPLQTAPVYRVARPMSGDVGPHTAGVARG